MTTADIFDPSSEWGKPLKTLFWNALVQHDWSPPNQSDDLKDSIETDLVKPDKWFFTVDGLQTAFNAYSGECDICDPGTPVVPWDMLKPFLAKDAVVP